MTNNTKVAVGMKVAFAPVGSEVVDEELGVGTTKIKAVKLKNVNSAGMLCSGKLLGLNEDGDLLSSPAHMPDKMRHSIPATAQSCLVVRS